MRIEELTYIAYGLFKGKPLDFSQGHEGLHIVYGANEAGKSTALRGLINFLFGFEHNVEDAYRYDPTELRVKGTMSVAGERQTFVRRRGRANTLLDMEMKPVNEASLTPYLGNLDRELFHTQFGIDHAELLKGAERLTTSQGTVGEILVNTELKTVTIRGILDQIKTEVDKLYKPKGQNQKINQYFSQYEAKQDEIKKWIATSRPYQEWKEQLKQKHEELSKIREHLEQQQCEKFRLERIQQAIPKLHQRQRLMEHLATLGDVVRLKPDFSERRQSILTKRNNLIENQRKIDSEITVLENELVGLSISKEILQASSEIRDLHGNLSKLQQALDDLPILGLEIERSRQRADAIVGNIPGQPTTDDLVKTKITSTEKKRLTQLVGEQERLLERQATLTRQIQDQRLSLHKAQQQLQAFPQMLNPGALKIYFETVLSLGDLEASVEELQLHINTEEAQVMVELKRLPWWQGSLEELEQTQFPLETTIASFRQHFEDLNTALKDCSRQISEKEILLRKAQSELNELQHGGEVPTEEDLHQARAYREKGWQLIRRAWLQQEQIEAEATEYHPILPLQEAYEHSVEKADTISDRLRREATRVSRKANLLATTEELAQSLALLEKELELKKQNLLQFQDEWQTLWKESRITPFSPAEMQSWLMGIPRILQRLESIRKYKIQLVNNLRKIEESKKGLVQQLHALGVPSANPEESLRELIQRSRELIATIEATEKKRHELHIRSGEMKQEQSNLEQDLQKVTHDLESWNLNWNEATRVLGSTIIAVPGTVNDILSDRDQVLNLLNDIEGNHIRICRMKTYIQDFANRVKALVQQVAPELTGRTTVETVLNLNNLLERTLRIAVQREEKEAQLLRHRSDLDNCKEQFPEVEVELQELLKEASCVAAEDLPQLEERSAQYSRYHNELVNLESSLYDLAPRGDLEQLILETGDINPDSLPGKIESLGTSITQLRENLETLNREIGSIEQVLKGIDGNDTVAQLTAESQDLLSHIAREARQYIRLSLAQEILKKEVEKFREANQEPLLKRAGEILKTLTLGSYVSLKSDFGKDDQVVLKGVRPDGEHVDLAGFSDGSLDQLYLSLRLAHLENHLKNNHPMPFIMDDILINFDNDRASATLKVLGEISEKTQIIYFTHHKHLLDLAEETLDRETLFIQTL